MQQVNEYMDRYEGEKKEWLTTFVRFMRENLPDIPETIFYQMPAYKFDGTYIAFSLASEHFTFHTLDFDMIEELRELLPGAKFGKGSAKVKYSDMEAIPVLFDAARRIIERNRKKL